MMILHAEEELSLLQLTSSLPIYAVTVLGRKLSMPSCRECLQCTITRFPFVPFLHVQLVGWFFFAHLFYFFFAFKKFFNLSIVDLQCCVRFWCIAKWYSYTYIYIFFFIFFSIMVFYRCVIFLNFLFFNFFNFNFLMNFYWSRVDLQCCVTFCCTAKWISYTYTYFHSFLDSFRI